jgi:hypothetical protein
MVALDDAEASIPDINAVLMLRIGPAPGSGEGTEARAREERNA